MQSRGPYSTRSSSSSSLAASEASPSLASGDPQESGTSLKYKEYKVKSFVDSVRHHLMIMPEKGFSFRDLVEPVKLYRQLPLEQMERLIPMSTSDSLKPSMGSNPSVVLSPYGNLASSMASQQTDPSSSTSNTGPLVGNKRSMKKKTHVILSQETAKGRRLRQEESVPWVLEDSDRRAWVGRYEGGQAPKYVLFVNVGNEFRVLLVNKWYKFSPKINYTTLTLEEAEQRMDSRKGTEKDRWMMHEKKQHQPETGKVSKLTMLKDELENEVWHREDKNSIGKDRFGRGQVKKLDRNESDEIDYDEIFDDDEESAEPADMSDDKESSKTKNGKTCEKPSSLSALSMSGRELKKTLKHLDKVNLYESDEEYDPYANKEDLGLSDSESENEDEKQRFVMDKKVTQVKAALSKSLFDIHSYKRAQSSAEEDSLMTDAKPTIASEAGVLKKQKVEQMSTSPTPQGPVDSSNRMLTEADVINALASGPISTKNLISVLKPKLNAHPENKDSFRVFVKKLAEVSAEPTSDNVRLLKLKNEYKAYQGTH